MCLNILIYPGASLRDSIQGGFSAILEELDSPCTVAMLYIPYATRSKHEVANCDLKENKYVSVPIDACVVRAIWIHIQIEMASGRVR